MLVQSQLADEDRVLPNSRKWHASKTVYEFPLLAMETFAFLMTCKQT
jgi:hypothetical protein